MKTKLLFAALVALICFGTAHLASAGLTFQLLYSFDGTNGISPVARLVQATNGNFYGTTLSGGAGYDGSQNSGNGTVFEITAGGTLTSLFSFDGWNGSYPVAELVQDSDDNFYGTTEYGGPGSDGTLYTGKGTAFQITTNGTLTTLVFFDGANGQHSSSGMVWGNDGNLYGTTGGGGANGYGTVFQLALGGTLTTLHSFSGADGQYPDDTLLQGSDGNFYATTRSGGAYGNGTVFKITPGGTLNTLVSFNGTNGYYPSTTLVEGSDGNFYGTTYYGGTNDKGTVFKITPGGTLTTLLSFNGTNGKNPPDGLAQGSDGNFYGTTSYGGTSDKGTVFKITPGGTLTRLFSFNGANGNSPQAGLVQGSDGNLYGTTWFGGAYDRGTIFRLVQPPRPVITAITQSNGIATLTWTSVANEIYRVEYKPSLAVTNWGALSPNVTATNSTASFSDNPADTERYYRVLLLR